MKLKPIPQNTVVSTPTEDEAKELLAILHENGYKWSVMWKSLINNNHWHHNKEYTTYLVDGKNKLVDVIKEGALMFDIVTLAEFKEKYVEEDEPQPKFKVGDRVRSLRSGNVYEVSDNTDRFKYRFKETLCPLAESALTPYTEPETKPTEDMETKEETKKLNLCEMPAAHLGETFYSLSLGEVKLKKIENNVVLCFVNEEADEPMYVNSDGTSRYGIGGVCLIYPSRTLYEQYPLDPLKAWSEWQEEQEIKCRIWLSVETKGERRIAVNGLESIFHSLSDRDKCIEEIKAIIEKYSNNSHRN